MAKNNLSIVAGTSTGNGNGNFQLTANAHYGREQITLGTVTVKAGSLTKDVTVYQKACSNFVSNTNTGIDTTKITKYEASTGHTVTVTIYSNMANFIVEKTPYNSNAANKIYSWNASGLNYDEQNSSAVYSDMTINSVTVDSVSKTPTASTATSSTYSAGNAGKEAMYAIQISFGVPANQDDAGITRRFFVGNTTHSVGLTIEFLQNAGSVTLEVQDSVTLEQNGAAKSVSVTSNTAWSVSVN